MERKVLDVLIDQRWVIFNGSSRGATGSTRKVWNQERRDSLNRELRECLFPINPACGLFSILLKVMLSIPSSPLPTFIFLITFSPTPSILSLPFPPLLTSLPLYFLLISSTLLKILQSSQLSTSHAYSHSPYLPIFIRQIKFDYNVTFSDLPYQTLKIIAQIILNNQNSSIRSVINKSQMALRRRILAAFDMDNTINTKVLESAIFEKINPMVRSKYIEGRKPWEERVMNAMSKHSYSLQEVTEHIKGVGLITGMKGMFANLKEKGVDIIILSGGNDLMVKIYLQQQGLDQYFSGIIANRLQESGGQLMYRPVSKVSPCISTCHNHLCKRHHLSEYVKAHKYQKVFMVGDGENDHCAFSWIKDGGAMIKSPSELITAFKNNKQLRQEITCPIYEWNDGDDLREQFDKAIPN